MSKFNTVIASNGKMREDIDHLLKDRAYFNKLYQQLVSRLNSGKKVMVDLIEQATLAYDQREEAQNKLRALKERGRQDVQQQSWEMRELQRRLDHDVKLQEFLGVKGQRRITADLEAREALKRSEYHKSPNILPEHACSKWIEVF
jgi:predicted DNA-binding ArsR family transcriptional regulator